MRSLPVDTASFCEYHYCCVWSRCQGVGRCGVAESAEYEVRVFEETSSTAHQTCHPSHTWCWAPPSTPSTAQRQAPASHNTRCHATTAGSSTHTHAPAHRWFGVAERLLGPEEVGEVGLGNGSDERLVLLLRGHQ